MKLLFLDDNIDRHFLVSKSIGRKHQVLHAHSAVDAIKAIKSSKTAIDIGMLDYDLGNGKIGGIQVLNYMYLHFPANQWFSNIISHTRNLHNGLALVSRASSWGLNATYQPFSQSLLRTLSH